jgi:hypothetical protein
MKYLQSQGFMDYSLLMAVGKKKSFKQGLMVNNEDVPIEKRLTVSESSLDTITSNLATEGFFTHQINRYEKSMYAKGD